MIPYLDTHKRKGLIGRSMQKNGGDHPETTLLNVLKCGDLQ